MTISHLADRKKEVITGMRDIFPLLLGAFPFGMIIPFVKSWPMGICVLTAGAASLLTLSLPYKLGIMVSAFAGIAAGLIAERGYKKRAEMVRA